VNRLLGAASVCLVATAAARTAVAAQLSTQVSSSRVEVGQEFTLQLSCMVGTGNASPSEPRLPVPRGLVAQGPSISTQQNVSIINGQIQQQSGVVATWVLVASATGHYRIGPATVAINGQRVADRAVDVEVVARGSLPQANRPRRRGRAFDPFDPFGGSDPFSGPMFPPGINLLPNPGPPADEIPSYPPDLNIDRPRDTLAFLDARLSSTRLVVGEQTTLRIYAYGKAGPFDLGLSSEPSRNEFLSYQNERDNQTNPLYRIKINSEIWFARRILSYALFPMKTGTLRIGEAEASFAGAGLLASNAYHNIQRRSQPLDVVVEEPPRAGRPPGYHIGDVGNFTLSATVEPRKINAGGSVSVQVEVSGTGQLPQRLDPPEQTGVDWLEPTTTQQIDNQRDRIAGRRQFTYVVRIEGSGIVHLGTIRYPYFDPTTRKYSVASAELGHVTVESANSQTTQASTASAANEDPFLLALHPRGKLGSASEPPEYWAERRSFFAWLAAGPVLSLGLFGAQSALRRLVNWRRLVADSARALLDAERKAARQALEAGDATRAAASVERLVHLLIEHSVGLRSRAILRSELAAEVEQRGIDAAQSRKLVSLLERCDDLRFVQPNVADAATLVDDAESVFHSLLPQLRKQSRRPG
jgi:hypothetical protein